MAHGTVVVRVTVRVDTIWYQAAGPTSATEMQRLFSITLVLIHLLIHAI